MTPNRILAFTVRTTISGEEVTPDIILNGGSILINKDRFPVTPKIFGNIEIANRERSGKTETILTSIPRLELPAMYSTYSFMDWYDRELDLEYHEELVAIVLLKARCKTNLRCPMSSNYWNQWTEAGSFRDDRTSAIKKQLKTDFPRNFDIRDSGAFKIYPDTATINKYEYLVGIANNGSFEWVLDRRDGSPNTYRIEFTDGDLKVIDPRAEARILADGANPHTYDPGKDR